MTYVPPPSNTDKIREKLQDSLDFYEISVLSFSKAAGVSNAAVGKFLRGTGKNKTKKTFLAKMEREMQRRGWLGLPVPEPEHPSPVATEALRVFRERTEDTEFHPSQLGQPQAEQRFLLNCLVSHEERADIIAAIMSLPKERRENHCLVKKLFPN